MSCHFAGRLELEINNLPPTLKFDIAEADTLASRSYGLVTCIETLDLPAYSYTAEQVATHDRENNERDRKNERAMACR